MRSAVFWIFIPIAVVTIAFSLVAFDLFSNCPLRWRFEIECSCYLRDERRGTKLMEIFDLDASDSWIVKSSSDRDVWLQHPDEVIPDAYLPRVSENVMKFKDDDLEVLIVNGAEYKPKTYDQRPKLN